MANILFWLLAMKATKDWSFSDVLGFLVALLTIGLLFRVIDEQMDPRKNGTPYFACRCKSTGYAGYTDANSGEPATFEVLYYGYGEAPPCCANQNATEITTEEIDKMFPK